MKNKVTIVLLVIILLITIIPASVFESKGIDTNITIGSTSAINSSKGMTNRIVGILQVVGSVISVLALVIIGIRYMFSSVEEKASMKGVIIYYIIGAVLVFATSNILSTVYKVIFERNEILIKTKDSQLMM